MIEHKELHDFASWRDEWTADDVEKALTYAGIKGWTFDYWSDGDMQFMHPGPVPFDDLAKLRITFTPLRMDIAAVVDIDAEDAQKLEDAAPKPHPPLLVLVTMSWNALKEVH